MKKVFIWLLLLVLLALGACLPMLSAWVGDMLQQEQVQFREMDPLTLTFASEEDIPLVNKLGMLMKGAESVYVEPTSENLADLQENILPKVFAQLDQYAALGALPLEVVEAKLEDAAGYLFYLPQQPEMNATVWSLSFRLREETMDVFVDGDTGTVLALEYYFGPRAEDVNRKYDKELVLEYVAQKYFDSLEANSGHVLTEYLQDGVCSLFHVETELGSVQVRFELTDSHFSVWPEE